MLQILVNCGDGYTDAATITPNQNIRTISIQVSAPNFVVCQVANKLVGGRPVFDQTEQALQPGPITFQNVYGVRFRNFTPGKVAVVQANAYFVGEAVPEGNLPSNVVFTTAGQTGGGLTSNVAPTPLASFPPVGPLDGDICVLELPSTYDPVGGKKIRWILSYNAGDAVWDVIGGPSLYAEVLTLETSTSTSYGDLATVGPSITPPRPGDYEVTIGASMDIVMNVAGCTGLMAYQGAGIAAASDNDAAISAQANAAVARYPGGASTRSREKTSLTTVSALVAKYRIIAGNSVDFQNRFMILRPIRIT